MKRTIKRLGDLKFQISNPRFIVAILAVMMVWPVELMSDAKQPPAAFIVNIVGKMEMRRANPGTWEAASIGVPLFRKDKIRTGEFGKATIKFVDGTIVKVSSNSELDILLANEEKAKDGSKLPPRGALDMKEGDIYSEVKKDKDQEFRIYTKTAVAAVKGTTLGLQADDRRTTLLVYEGTVQLENAFGKMLTEAKRGGQVMKSEATKDAAPTAPVATQTTQGWVKTVENAPKLRLDLLAQPSTNPAGSPFRLMVAVLDQAGKPVGGRQDKVTFSSSSKTMRFSEGGTNWAEGVTIGLRDGKAAVMAMDATLGGATVTAVSPELSPENESITIMPEQKGPRKKELRGRIRSKDGKEFKFIHEYQKP